MYKDKAGFLITGRNNYGQRFRIFAKSREGAQKIQVAAKQGDSATVDCLLLAGR